MNDAGSQSIAADSSESASFRSRALLLVVLCGLVSAAIYSVIGDFAPQFDSVDVLPRDAGRMQRARPILLVIGLFVAAFAIHIIALNAALKCSAKSVMPVIIGFAVLFRIVLVGSTPIQEIDPYRYLWDGAVTAHGVSPYQFAPATIRDAESIDVPTRDTDSSDFERLVQLRDSDELWQTVLDTIHFSKIATVYPPVSQAVFAASYATTPKHASRHVRLTVLKLWISLFDLITFLLVIHICWLVRVPMQYALVYGWCPLVLKEFANSGHLDAIAVCFSVVSVWFVVKTFSATSIETRARIQDIVTISLGAFCLALAIAAKLYPAILAPAFAIISVRRIGFARTLIPITVCIATSVVLLWPMFNVPKQTLGPDRTATSKANVLRSDEVPDQFPSANFPSDEPQIHQTKPQEDNAADARPEQGLQAFLTRWEMNDLIFSFVMANVTPDEAFPKNDAAWYVFVPNAIRVSLADVIQSRWDVSLRQAGFLLARGITVGLFVLVAGVFYWQCWKEPSALRLLRTCFLVTAWFWLLAPTQNPWYWIWAIPFLPFAGRAAWLYLSPLLFLYYLRFWLLYHFGQFEVLNTGYAASGFFNHVVVWIEFVPWLVVLAVSRKPLVAPPTNQQTE